MNFIAKAVKVILRKAAFSFFAANMKRLRDATRGELPEFSVIGYILSQQAFLEPNSLNRNVGNL